jgi:hypothetical protein
VRAVMARSMRAQAPAASATPVQLVSKSLGLIVYPANKQSASQQSVDEQECYNWAKAQTGIDPQAPPPAAQPAEAPKGERNATFRNAVGTCLQGRGYTTG